MGGVRGPESWESRESRQAGGEQGAGRIGRGGRCRIELKDATHHAGMVKNLCEYLAVPGCTYGFAGGAGTLTSPFRWTTVLPHLPAHFASLLPSAVSCLFLLFS